jgi:cytochrome bd-type quinol oxidase subunit 2
METIKTLIEKRGSTHFLRFMIVLMGVIAAAICIFALPAGLKGASAEFPYASQAVFLITLALYAMAIPFFIALWQSLKLLTYIDQNTAFSEASVQALRNIKRSAIVVSALAVMCVPLLFPIADADDAPGLLVFGAIFACAPIAIAVFAAILQRLLQNAIDIKSENDLTV